MALLTQLSQPVPGGLSGLRMSLHQASPRSPHSSPRVTCQTLPPCQVHTGSALAAGGPTGTQALWGQEGEVRLAARSEPPRSCCPDRKPQVGRWGSWAGSFLCILTFLLQHPSDGVPQESSGRRWLGSLPQDPGGFREAGVAGVHGGPEPGGGAVTALDRGSVSLSGVGSPAATWVSPSRPEGASLCPHVMLLLLLRMWESCHSV